MTEKRIIRVGHSPDSDDAFMFYALAKNKLDVGPYEFRHELVDIETLNRRAFHGELELTAVSVHAYAYLNDVYALCNCGASMGDKYGPMLIAKQGTKPDALRSIAIPGTLTTAVLALKLWLALIGQTGVEFVLAPFDQILEIVAAGSFENRPIDAGVVIHEGQLTYPEMGLELLVDFGDWWFKETGLPLPLGANAIRRDLPWNVQSDVVRLLHESIAYGLKHRAEALDYALSFARGLERNQADQFVGMYVNDWTLDFGDTGRKAVRELLLRGYEANLIPKCVVPEFV